jgi:hypothetical protein
VLQPALVFLLSTDHARLQTLDGFITVATISMRAADFEHTAARNQKQKTEYRLARKISDRKAKGAANRFDYVRLCVSASTNAACTFLYAYNIKTVKKSERRGAYLFRLRTIALDRESSCAS